MRGELITAEEQLARWVAGESIHRMGGSHSNLRAIDPPGSDNRRWMCECSAVGMMATLRAEPCPAAGECVPDFSCCKPELKSDDATRSAYATADGKGRARFHVHFLGAALAHTGLAGKVHIAGRGTGDA